MLYYIQVIDLRLYTNPVFYLAFEARVVRVEGDQVAIEFVNTREKSVIAVLKLLEFFELAVEVAELSH